MKRLLLTLLVCALIGTGCGSGTGYEGLKTSVRIVPEELTDFGYLTLDVTLDPQEGFVPWSGERQIYVDFWRERSRERLLTTVNPLATPPTQWKPGHPIQFRQTCFIPRFLDELDPDFEGFETLRVEMGLMDPHGEKPRITLWEKRFPVEPASLVAPEVLFTEGWNNLEVDPQAGDPRCRQWRWTTRRAVCQLENTGHPCDLIIRGKVEKSILPDQEIRILLGEKELDHFKPEGDLFERSYRIDPSTLPEGNDFTLSIVCSETFIPANRDTTSQDQREMGAQIFFMYYRVSMND